MFAYIYIHVIYTCYIYRYIYIYIDICTYLHGIMCNVETVVQYHHLCAVWFVCYSKADVGNMHDNDNNDNDDDDVDDDVDDEHVNVASLMTAGEVQHDQHVRWGLNKGKRDFGFPWFSNISRWFSKSFLIQTFCIFQVLKRGHGRRPPWLLAVRTFAWCLRFIGWYKINDTFIYTSRHIYLEFLSRVIWRCYHVIIHLDTLW